MNKKITTWVITTILLCNIVSGCGGNNIDKIAEENGLQTLPSISESSIETIPMPSAPSEESVIEVTTVSTNSISDGDVDVDLTVLSSTMVYSEVYNMVSMPDEYVGQVVRMNGMFVIYTNQDQSQFYPAVIIADATACCSQGIEFVLEGDPPYPEGYPEINTEITVVGTFETYDENGVIFCHLVNAVIE